MKTLKCVFACFLSCVILLQSCSTTLEKATKEEIRSKVFFKDSIKDYSYIIKRDNQYYGVILELNDFPPIMKSELLIEDNIIDIKLEKKRTRSYFWETVGGVLVICAILAIKIIIAEYDDDDWWDIFN